MDISVQRRLAASVLKCSEKRIWFDEERLDEIKEAITKVDLRGLIADKAIQKKPKRGISRFFARLNKNQKKKGRQKGHGSRKGKLHAREPGKKTWMNKIRLQRTFLRQLKDDGKLDKKIFRELYLRAKGGSFRSLRHMKLYLTENKLIKNEKL